MNSAETLTFSVSILAGVSSSSVAFFLLRFLISLITSTSFTALKEKRLALYASCIAVMLGCLLYFITDVDVKQDIL